MLTGNDSHVKHQNETYLQAFAGPRYNDGQTALDGSLSQLCLLVAQNTDASVFVTA